MFRSKEGELIPHILLSDSCIPLAKQSRTIAKKMSALQTFLLVVDHNKEEAKQIAERIAQGEFLSVKRSGESVVVF